MKKILLVGLLLFVTSIFADDNNVCGIQDLGDCTFLYTCKNDISLLIKKRYSSNGECITITEKIIIADKTKSVTTIKTIKEK